jgi:hypothetical protein
VLPSHNHKPLPVAIVAHVSLAYTQGATYNTLCRELHVTARYIRRALEQAGTPIRPRGWPAGRIENRATREITPQALDYALAQSLQREAALLRAEIARRDTRCACGGVRRSGVPHRCAGRIPRALAFEGVTP